MHVFLDRTIKGTRRISFHPNINTRTIVLSYEDFERFLAACHRQARYLDIERS